jgi:hypothetical protein
MQRSTLMIVKNGKKWDNRAQMYITVKCGNEKAEKNLYVIYG